jgi:hypothetical protein
MIAEKHGNLVITIKNIHAAACGEPPAATNGDAGRYHSYFEGLSGDQWLFVYDRETRKGTLYGGDIDWTTPLEVTNGSVRGLILDGCEAAWLQACWAAATASPMRDESCNLLAYLAQKAVALADEVDVGRQP